MLLLCLCFFGFLIILMHYIKYRPLCVSVIFDQSKQQTYVKLLANLISFSFLIRKIIEFFLLYDFPSTFPYLLNWAYWIIYKISTIHVRNLFRIFERLWWLQDVHVTTSIYLLNIKHFPTANRGKILIWLICRF